jgi:hypothetical protein
MLSLFMVLAAPAHAASSYKDYKKFRMWQLDKDQCLSVPGGDYRAGVQLRTARCNPQDANQYFLWEDDGHLVANNGNATGSGRMCVDSDGWRILIQPCRRLTTGDRQWWKRDAWGFMQNNHGLECMGLAPGDRVRVVVTSCSDLKGINSWVWYPFTREDQLQQIRDIAEARANDQVPNTPSRYDPEKRSRWEDMVRQYGPYVVMTDTRTGYCVQPHPTLSALIAGHCGKGVQRFHLGANGLLREVRMDGGYRGVSGLCVTAPLSQGGHLGLEHCNANRLEQRWWIVNGQVQSQSRAAAHRCLDVANESRQLNAYLIAWPCQSSRPGNQAFRITYERQFLSSYL